MRRYIVAISTAFALCACGGVAFTDPADLFTVDPPDGAGVALDAGERAVGDAATDSPTPDDLPDAADTLDADAHAADVGVDAPSDAADSAAFDAEPDVEPDAEPACATKPPVVAGVSCGGSATTWTEPQSVCVSTSTSQYLATTPPECASWCTYTCACIFASNICGAGATPSCEPQPSGLAFYVNCSTP